jgi:hypothetical protein
MVGKAKRDSIRQVRARKVAPAHFDFAFELQPAIRDKLLTDRDKLRLQGIVVGQPKSPGLQRIAQMEIHLGPAVLRAAGRLACFVSRSWFDGAAAEIHGSYNTAVSLLNEAIVDPRADATANNCTKCISPFPA